MKVTKFAILLAMLFGAVQASGQASPQSLDVGEWSGSGCCSELTRGYWFVAPIDFTIVRLTVPTSGPGQGATLEVVRLNAVPPEFPGTTNEFSQLGFWAGVTTVETNIQVSAGDVIGVLGWADGISPYRNASGPYATTLGGEAVTLTRFGFQDRGEARDVWSEASGQTAVIGLDYIAGPIAAPVPIPTMSLWGLLLLAMLVLAVVAFRRTPAGTA